MQVKTIRKNIENKMEDWLSSITDEKLRQKVKNNLLVSGGSITSMFLNEEVNDYDIYIKDMDILVSLVKYYINPLYTNKITILDGREKERALKIYNGIGTFHYALENLKKEQVKLFFTEKDGGLRIDENHDNKDTVNYLPTFFSPNAISLSKNIQIVTRFHGDNEQIHKTFDFIHATNYFTFKEGLVTNKEALGSILTKQLKYQGSLYPLTSIIRMKKFIKRGWKINAGEILKILFQISELDLSDIKILEEQLIGIDVAYFSKLIDILRNNNIEKVTSHYLDTLIDKVFNEEEGE